MSSVLGTIKNEITNFLNGNASPGVTIATSLYSLCVADEQEDVVMSLSEIAVAAAGLDVSANQLYCAVELMLNPAAMWQVLNGIASSFAGAMADLLNDVMVTLQQQILLAANTVFSSVFGAVEAMLSLLNQIIRLTDLLVQLPKKLKDLALSDMQRHLSLEQCEEMAAAILSCLLNKYLGDPIEKFQKKIKSKITEVGSSINQALIEEFNDLNVMTNYIKQEAFMLNKACLQIDGLYANIPDATAKQDQIDKKAEEATSAAAKSKVTVGSDGKAKVTKSTNYNTSSSITMAADADGNIVYSSENRESGLASFGGGDVTTNVADVETVEFPPSSSNDIGNNYNISSSYIGNSGSVSVDTAGNINISAGLQPVSTSYNASSDLQELEGLSTTSGK